MTPTARPDARKPPRQPLSEAGWKRLLVLLIAGVAFLGAAVGALQVDAGARAARYSRDARAAMLRSIAKSSSATVRSAYERERLAAHQALATEWIFERRQATASAAAAADAEAAQHAQSANRLWDVMQTSRDMSTLLSAPYFDEAAFVADVVQFNVDYFTVPSVLASEQDAAQRAQSTAWGNKAERYVVTITILAVSLFLLGLALTLRGGLRRLFAWVGGLITAGLVAFVLLTALAATPTVPDESLSRYADAAGHLTYAAYAAPLGKTADVVERAGKAVDLASQAIALSPGYAAAYELRGLARLLAAQESFYARAAGSPSTAEFVQAVADFDRAAALGRDSGSLEDQRASALSLAGRTNDAIAASRRALALAPEQRLRFGLHLSILLLGAGLEDEALLEAEGALRWAELHRLGSDPVTFHEAIRILDRLAFLGWPGLDALEARVKEAFVSLTHRGTVVPLPLTAHVGPLRFYTARESEGERRSETRTRFPGDTQAVGMGFDVDGLAAGAILVVQVSRNGIEQPSLGWVEAWSGPTSGSVERTIGASVRKTVFGLVPGTYGVEVYIDGTLALRGSFVVE